MPPTVFRCNRTLLLFAAGLAWMVAGCAAVPARDTLPSGMQVTGRISVAAGSPAAWDATGTKVAIVRDRLYLWMPESGDGRAVADLVPTALAWSPDGERLAAVVPAGADSRLLLLSAAGDLVREATVPGRVPRLAWRGSGELLFIAATLKEFKFGGNFALQLYRWPLAADPAAEPLFDTTVMPRTVAQWGEILAETAAFSLSPLGDAILFARLRDPPAFSPHREIVLRHLTTGSEESIAAQLPLTGGRPRFAADGEGVLYGDGSRTHRYDPWLKQDRQSYAAAGRHIAVSPGGSYLLIDGRLYRNGEEIAVFPAVTEGWFSPIGDRLLLRQGNKLLLLAGLSEPPPPELAAAARERLLLLRRWRSSGLITHAEFLQQMKRTPPDAMPLPIP